jgi:hypothetical protein
LQIFVADIPNMDNKQLQNIKKYVPLARTETNKARLERYIS